MTPQNDDPMPQGGAPQPEIPSFKDTKEEEKKGGGFSWFGKGGGGPKPLLRVRGLGGTSIIERLKQFRKKDLAFIASGIAVLLLAPLAEHYILGPGEEQKTLTQGFDQKGNPFSDAAGNVYEPGAGGFAPGGLPGQSSDVITPLNVRDPAALVMGPGAAQQPPTQVPPAKETSKEDWKEALSNAAQKGARAAEPAPFNKGTLAGSIRGLSALSGASGGGGPSWSLPAPSAAGVPNQAAGSHALTRVQAAPGFQGAAGHSNSQGSGGADALRRAAEQAANQFNRAGGAAGALQSAASQNIPGGGAADDRGGPGGGSDNKAPGGNSSKDNKSLGESLAFLKAKMEMEKALDLKWKKINWAEFEKGKMMQETIIKAALDGIIKQGFIDPLGKAIADIFPSPNKGPSTCVWVSKDGSEHDEVTFPSAKARDDCKKGGGGESTTTNSVKCNLYNELEKKYRGDPLFCTGTPSKPSDQKPGQNTPGTMEGNPVKGATGLTDEINRTDTTIDGALGQMIGVADDARKADQEQLEKLCKFVDEESKDLCKKLRPILNRIDKGLGGLQQLQRDLKDVSDIAREAKNQSRLGLNVDNYAENSGGYAAQAHALVLQAANDLAAWEKLPDGQQGVMQKIDALEAKLEEHEGKNPHTAVCEGQHACLTEIKNAQDKVIEARNKLCGDKDSCSPVQEKEVIPPGQGSIRSDIGAIHAARKEVESGAGNIGPNDFPPDRFGNGNLRGKGELDHVVQLFATAVQTGDKVYNKVNDTVKDTGDIVHQSYAADVAVQDAENKVREKTQGSVYPLLKAVADEKTKTGRDPKILPAKQNLGDPKNPGQDATASGLDYKAGDAVKSALDKVGNEAK